MRAAGPEDATRAGDEHLPFGAPEALAAVGTPTTVLDAGCGSGRLTVALARTGARVTGLDTSVEALREARRRAVDAGVDLELVRADMDAPLPFADARFDAVTSRLSLMVARDPVSTIRELARVLAPGGRIATVLWASLSDNPWFSAPRDAIREVLGQDRASFASAFGRLGAPDEAAAAHRAAGLIDVGQQVLLERIDRADATDHWRQIARDNGHFRRVDETLDDAERNAIVRDLSRRLDRFRESGTRMAIPRTIILVTARRPIATDS